MRNIARLSFSLKPSSIKYLKKMNFIEQLYVKNYQIVPPLCVDLIIIYKNKFLLIKRKQEPLKDEWWVPKGFF